MVLCYITHIKIYVRGLTVALGAKKILPEVFVSDESITQVVSGLVKRGKARKIAPRLYTTNMTEPPEVVVRRNLWQIVGALAPYTVIGWRTAFISGASEDGSVFLTGPYKREIKIPGKRISIIKGAGRLEGDNPFISEVLFMASEARQILENLMPTKAKGNDTRSVGQKGVEDKLVRILQNRGEERLNELRDHAKRIAPQLNALRELDILNDLIGSLLRTRTTTLVTPVAQAFAAGIPYDPHCVERFEQLRQALASDILPFRPRANVPPAFTNEAFYDAYFSNYIEGTEFTVDEALGIVFEGKIPVARPDDAHDVIGTYQVVGNFREIFTTPKSFESFLDLLRSRHATILGGRPNKRPGEFKEILNQAGSSVFVAPELVSGTLKQGYDIYQSLRSPTERALFMMFMVSEIHPFDDGNGRVSRAMMNSELLAGGLCRIIIPSVFRNEYVSSLKRLKNHRDPSAYIRVMLYAQDFVTRIDFTDIEYAKSVLTECNAFSDPADNVRLALPGLPISTMG